MNTLNVIYHYNISYFFVLCSSYKRVTVNEMKKRWTKFHKHVNKNFVIHNHSNGRDIDGETIPSFVRPLYDYILRNKPCGKVSRQEKERVDAQLMPRQRPLGGDVLAEPRSEQLCVNVRNGVTNLAPNHDLDINRAVPIDVEIEGRTIRDKNIGGGGEKKKGSKKRKHNRYHDAIFGSDDEYDGLKSELKDTTSAVTKLIAAQQMQMISEQSDNFFSQYNNAQRMLETATDPDDIEFYMMTKRRAMRMMKTLNDGDESE